VMTIKRQRRHGAILAGLVLTTLAAVSATPASALEPTATTQPATGAGFAWTLHGTLNGQSLPTSYHFDYTDSGKVQSEIRSTAQTGADTSPLDQAVSAVIPEPLNQCLIYSFRLVVTNADGTVEGEWRTFVTPCPQTGSPNPTVPQCIVPSLVGMRLKGARRALIARGCTLGKVQGAHKGKRRAKRAPSRKQHPPNPKRVDRQSVPAGTSVPRDFPVGVRVSRAL